MCNPSDGAAWRSGTPPQRRPFRLNQTWACSAAAQAQRSLKLFAEANLLVDAQGEQADTPCCWDAMLEQGSQMNRSEAACALLPGRADCFQMHTQGVALTAVLQGAHLCLTSR